jgi:hypothetical protein
LLVVSETAKAILPVVNVDTPAASVATRNRTPPNPAKGGTIVAIAVVPAMITKSPRGAIVAAAVNLTSLIRVVNPGIMPPTSL